ncbi:MAG TPA: trypsin-like serine protease, partial [Kofleriaceae bacterium]|nr:trypsin-like serine protease [Kofleriaceae bacterium]
MRVALAALACSLFPAAGWAGGPPAAAPSSPVIGGEDAKPGKWPDVVAVLFPDDTGGDEALCTGTLVAPTVVLTAAHCLDPLDPPAPDNVLIGTSSLARPGEGEIIAIKDSFLYPDPETTEDLAVLVLDHASSRTPRKVVDGWARFDLVDGATVELVGFGAIDQDGVEFIDELQEASSKITDADCTRSMGCNAEAQPAGELGAGGMGIDTCSGDSGGPLYLMASYGPVLAGVTARSYDNAPVMCSDGGIYVRPDKVLDWIEMVAGVRIARFPGPTAEPITAVHG